MLKMGLFCGVPLLRENSRLPLPPLAVRVMLASELSQLLALFTVGVPKTGATGAVMVMASLFTTQVPSLLLTCGK